MENRMKSQLIVSTFAALAVAASSGVAAAPDLIVVNGDPLQDLSLLQHEVLVVIKDGRAWFPDHNFPARSSDD